MDNPSSPDLPPSVATADAAQHSEASERSAEPFKSWPDCSKALKTLPKEVSEMERRSFVERITASAFPQSIAFELLWLLQFSKTGRRFRWLEEPMTNLLGHGAEEPALGVKTTPSEAASWVYREFQEVRNLAEWKAFVASGRHLWILHSIFSAGSNKPVVVEALAALAECIEHAHNSGKPCPSNQTGIDTSDVKWIVNLLKARVPGKLDLSKGFLESLFAVSSTAGVSEEVRKESTTLQRRLAEASDALASEKGARHAADDRVDLLERELTSALKIAEELRRQLNEERLHTTRQGGFNAVAKKETVNKVLSVVRRGVVHRLENIRGYADRPNPDRVEILSLVGEIEKHLAKVEEVIGE